MNVVANKFQKIRAAIIMNADQAFDARNDDDVNVLVLPADYLTSADVRKILIAWLEAPFSREERFRRRLEKISRIEEKFIQPFSAEKSEYDEIQ